MENSPQTFMERVSKSVFLKLALMFFLILVLLIPMNWVNELISERHQRNKEVSNEIASKWGLSQVISSPLIAVPYKTFQKKIMSNDKNENYSVIEEGKEWIFLLPDQVDIISEVNPDTRKRGIYESVVYTADIHLKGNFPEIDLKNLKVEAEHIQWSEGKLIFGISDLKGLSMSPDLQWDSATLTMHSNMTELDLFENSLTADLNLTGGSSTNKQFEIKVKVRGSQSVSFFPLANHTKIDIKGNWNHPSFNGAYLPDERLVEQGNFSAHWNIPNFNRKLAKQWNGHSSRLYQSYASSQSMAAEYAEPHATSDSQFSEDLVSINFLPDVDNYQKTTRVAKYGILIIMLTFVSLFFTEIIKKQRVHLIQYVLIGAAMVLFYSLLLAISEHLGFNWAYAMAALATVILITTFIRSITKNTKTAALFASILTLFYGFIYLLLQLRDFSLIVGTVGVFIILAVLMRLSTKINWYQFEQKNLEQESNER